MRALDRLRSALRARLAAEDGYALIAVLGVLLAGSALTVAAFAAARGDIHLSRYDQDQKRAYAAAEAGINDYFFHLTQDNAYWAKCASPTPAHPALNLAGARPLRTRRVPGSDARYAIELLPANGRAQCDINNATGSMIVAAGGPMSGTFSVRATGFANGARRSVVATFRRRSFLDYLYFTDLETSDPVWYVLESKGRPTRPGQLVSSRWSQSFDHSEGAPDLTAWAASRCPVYWRNGRGSLRWPASPDTVWQQQFGTVWRDESSDSDNWETRSIPCGEIRFVSGDYIQGPLHTNDDMLVCGTPTFGRTPQDSIEVSGSGWRPDCASSPEFKGTWKPHSPVLTPPPSSTALKQVVDAGYLFRGETRIVLQQAQMSVTIDGVTQTLPFPARGVVYVDHGTGGCPAVAYNPLDPYREAAGCALAKVSGTYTRDLTIASAKDVIVEGDVLRDGDPMLGLIADNFVRVYHKVTVDPDDPTDCTNARDTPMDVTIHAAILALNHSFTVDRYFCGGPLGRLTVSGTIAQKHRGPVGRGSGTTVANGYLKNYVYDDRLRLREPPHFIDPVQASWRIQRYAEQVGGG